MHLPRHGVTISWFTRATTFTITILLALISAVLSINVNVPDSFEQCMPAVINLTQTRGNVTILIREDGVRKALVNVTLPVNTTAWTWPAVDIAAGENFTITVTDHSKKRAQFSELEVDPSTTNDTSCLPVSNSKHHKDDPTDSNPQDDGGNGDGGMGSHSPQHHTIKTTEVSVIAGVLGGLLLALLSLILIMCWRRRRESKNHSADDASKDAITAHRIGEMGERLDSHRVITLFNEDGRAEGQAILGREGDAGWSYMSRLAPGLQTTHSIQDLDNRSPNQGRSGRRGLKTRRYDNGSKDGDLPSYGLSEYEKKALPKYAADQQGSGLIPQNAAMVLTTRHDSQGSRLTFSPDTLDPNGISSTPRQSTRVQPTVEEEDDEGVVVFRPLSNRSLLPYERNDAAAAAATMDRESVYSNVSHVPSQNLQASSTSIDAHPTSGFVGHRRSQSEVSLRRNHLSVNPFR